MDKKKAVGYLRSSPMSDSSAIENQKKAILDYAEKNGYEIVKFFIDERIRGDMHPLDREGYKKMIEYCEANNIKTIMVYNITRISRDIRVLFFDEFRRFVEKDYELVLVR